ncbi:MFS transporter [Thiofilum flexile]|uniref:MFS transporter n=1 Tax=Thiofilum flexile TaxID=125627 RepID=UPI000379CECC|nr:MFS transporter [Thiofilum flexile]
MTRLEWRVAGSLAMIYAARMLGLFMIMPVFSLYAPYYPHHTDFLVGLAIGIYGLTQAFLQIPLGILSDRIGRKPVIIGGLLCFALGSIVAALATTIEGVIIGRALQGMGAISAVTLALAADLTQEQNRTRVMSVIGITIALSFAAGMVLGPLISQYYGIVGVFWFTAALAVIGMVLIVTLIPTPDQVLAHPDTGILRGYLGEVLHNPIMMRLNAGVFTLHMIMTSSFLVIPTLLSNSLNLDKTEHWKIYLPIFFAAFVLSVPMIIAAEKYRKMRTMLISAIVLLVVAEGVMSLSTHTLIGFLMGFLVFFIGFNFLEASQPSLVAKYAKVNLKGTAMSLYSMAQVLGIFVGGALGGYIKQHFGLAGIFISNAMIAGIWLLLALGLPAIKFYTTRIIRLDPSYLTQKKEVLEQALGQVQGVQELYIDSTTGRAYLKVDEHLDEQGLAVFSHPRTGSVV